MSKQSRGGTNAYLFLNLVITGVLLVELITGKAVWDASLKFSNVLLVLVVINTLLIFKDAITGKLESKRHKKKHIKKSKHTSLLPIRNILRNTDSADPDLLKKVVSKLHELSGSLKVELYNVDKRRCESLATAGENVPALNGARFIIKNENITLVYSGSLGEEIIARADKQSPTEVKSSVSNLIMTVLPISVSGENQLERLYICLFIGNEEKPYPVISLSSASLYLETMVALYEGVKLNQNLEYLDRETGIVVYSKFAEALQTELERSERYKQSMTLLSLRIEGFEKLTEENQRQVHKAAGTEIKQILRRFDRLFLGKKGGEYYAILMEADESLAGNISGRIIKIFNKCKNKFSFEGSVDLQMRAGSATYPTDASMAEGLLELSIENICKSDKNEENGAKK